VNQQNAAGELISNDNKAVLDSLIESRGVLSIANGTSVQVIENTPVQVRVRVLEG